MCFIYLFKTLFSTTQKTDGELVAVWVLAVQYMNIQHVISARLHMLKSTFALIKNHLHSAKMEWMEAKWGQVMLRW